MIADIIIENISTLITLEGEDRARLLEDTKDIGIYKNGFVAIKDDVILFAGDVLPEDIERDSNTIIIDGRGKTVTPGLVDSHTHLVHGGSRENELAMKLKGAAYLDILEAGGGIHSTVRATKAASFDELYNKAWKTLDNMISFGVTTVEAKSGYGLEDFETEKKQLEVAKKLNEDHTMDIISTFMGAHAVPDEYKSDSDKFVDIIVNEMMPYVAENKLAKFNDVFCEEGVFSVEQSRRILEEGKKYGLIPKVHADEIIPIGGAELAAETNCISADHLVAASDKGIKMMAEEGVIANLLPATSFNLQVESYARARYMLDQGVAVALSTDYNPGSSPCENMQLVMSFGSIAMRLTPEEVITACTINGAASLGVEDKVGSLMKGKKADIAIFDSENLEYIIYHFGINHIDTVIKNGKIVFKNEIKIG